MPVATQQRLDKALAQHRAQNWSKAEALYLQLLADDPEQVTALYLLGSLYYQTQKVEKVLLIYKKPIN